MLENLSEYRSWQIAEFKVIFHCPTRKRYYPAGFKEDVLMARDILGKIIKIPENKFNEYRIRKQKLSYI